MGRRIISKQGLASKYFALMVVTTSLFCVGYLAGPKDLIGWLVISVFSLIMLGVWWFVLGRICGLRLSTQGNGVEACRFIKWAKVPFQTFEVKSAGLLTRLYGIYRLEYISGSLLYKGSRHSVRMWTESESKVLTKERNRIVRILEQSSTGGIRIT